MCCTCLVFFERFFFFFKQKTAYEMRISDWSSDVCSSDLLLRRAPAPGAHRIGDPDTAPRQRLAQQAFDLGVDAPEIGRRRALDRRMERGIEAQRKRFFCRNRHDSLLIERAGVDDRLRIRSEEHTSELQSLMRTSYAVVCLKK